MVESGPQGRIVAKDVEAAAAAAAVAEEIVLKDVPVVKTVPFTIMQSDVSSHSRYMVGSFGALYNI